MVSCDYYNIHKINLWPQLACIIIHWSIIFHSNTSIPIWSNSINSISPQHNVREIKFMVRIFVQSILLIFLRYHTNQLQAQAPIMIEIFTIKTLIMDITSIYVLEIDPYYNYTVAMMCMHEKIFLGGEMIIQYPMAWYQVLHTLIIEWILFLFYHIFIQNKPTHVHCSALLLYSIFMPPVVISWDVVLQKSINFII